MMALVATYPGLPPKPWTYRQIDGAYVVTDAQDQDVLAIPFDDNQGRATAVADFVCDARDAA